LFALGAAFQVGASAIWQFFKLGKHDGLIQFLMQVAGYGSVIGAIVLGTVLIFTALIRAEWVFFGVQVQPSPSDRWGRAKSLRFWFGVILACFVEIAMLQTIWVTFTAT
jgi:hypothetical protein